MKTLSSIGLSLLLLFSFALWAEAPSRVLKVRDHLPEAQVQIYRKSIQKEVLDALYKTQKAQKKKARK